MIATSIGLKTHIWNNNARCIMLLALYPFLILATLWLIVFSIGFLGQDHSYNFNNADDSYFAFTNAEGIKERIKLPEIGASSTQASQKNKAQENMQKAWFLANHMVWKFLPSVITIVIIWFIIAWFFHTSMIRKLSHSHPVTREEEPALYNLVENLCIAQGISTPRIEIIETHARNAFASGIDKKSYSITLTRGLINSLSKDELEGVLAHELTHILNHDVRLLIVCVIFTGIFGFAMQLLWSGLRHNVFYSSGRRDNNPGAAVLVIFVMAIILWLGYMATLFMRFALSRHREFMADAGAVEMTKNPDALMRALMRIAGRDRIPGSTDDIAMMCIENHVPFLGLFSTHPPIKNRIAAISRFTNTPVPMATSLAPAQPEERFATQNPEKPRQNPWFTRQRRD